MYWNTTDIQIGTFDLEIYAYDANDNIGVSEKIIIHITLFAVRKGFEPPKQFPVYTLSKRAP